MVADKKHFTQYFLKSVVSATGQRVRQSLLALAGQHCVICQSPDTLLCQSCQNRIKKPQYRCDICGCALSAETTLRQCLACQRQPPAYKHVDYLGVYDGVLAQLIIRAKIYRQVSAIAAIRGLLEHYLLNNQLDLWGYSVLAMPTPKSRLLQRGFNLPSLIARQLSRHYQLPLMPLSAVTLPFYLHKQTTLNRRGRQQNQHHYRIHMPVNSQILIVDDIMTTGETVNQLATQLQMAGAKNIAVWVLARGQMHYLVGGEPGHKA